MKISGKISLYVDGKLISQSNTIHPDLKNYLIGTLISTDDESMNDYFTDSGPQGASHTGKDGIILKIYQDTYIMNTESELVIENDRKRWKAVFSHPSTLGITEIQIGHDLKSEANSDSDRFNTMYATKEYPATINLQPNQPLLVIWEIKIERA